MKNQSILISIIILLFSNVATAGIIVAWGDNSTGLCNVPDGNDFVAVDAGEHHGLAIRSDGTLVSWGNNHYGECNVPDGNDFVSVVGGVYHSVALKSDGSLAAWGDNRWNQCDVPDGNDFVKVGAGERHSVAIKLDGSLVYWGQEGPNVPDVPAGNDYIDVAAGRFHSVALRYDGSLVSWGLLCEGECNVPEGSFDKIAAIFFESFALASDGSLAAWGQCDERWGRCDVPDGNNFIDVGPCVAIKADGSLTAWGTAFSTSFADSNIPDGNDSNTPPSYIPIPDGNGFVSVDAGLNFGIALTSDETVTLTVNVEPGGIDTVTPSAGEHEYYRGKRVYINARRCPICPDVYDFDHWEGDIEEPNSPSDFLTMNKNRTITAVYVLDERVCGDECHPILKGDLNEDCYINFEDFVIYSEFWLSCTHPDCD